MDEKAVGPSEEELRLALKLGDIFQPYARKKTSLRYPTESGSARFVHYTSAEAAIKIIRTKRIWMRNATCMADYREVIHGHEMLVQAFNELLDSFKTSLNKCVPGIADEALKTIDERVGHIIGGTYVTSLSEHDDSEDEHGRLSMWRAFSPQSARVALVVSIPWLSGSAAALNVIFSPVAYWSERQVLANLMAVIEGIDKEAAFLQTTDRSVLLNSVFMMFLSALTCLKHVGFHEEREWRAIYCPQVFAPSPLIRRSTETVNGVPQHVHQMPLDIEAAPFLADLDIARILDRVIIGPTQYPMAIRDALVYALVDAKISDAGQRVYISGIPIRT